LGSIVSLGILKLNLSRLRKIEKDWSQFHQQPFSIITAGKSVLIPARFHHLKRLFLSVATAASENGSTLA